MGRFCLIASLVLLVALIVIHSKAASTDWEEEWLEDEYIPPSASGKQSGSQTEDVSGESQQLANLTIKWEDLSWKILCDEDEWRKDFDKIRRNLTRCLELTRIMLPDETEEDPKDESQKMMQRMAFMFSDGKNNPYCRMSRNWRSCHHYLKGISCLDPNPTPLVRKGKKFMYASKINSHIPSYPDPNEWIYMHRAYKIMCLMSKLASKYNPLNFFAGGWF